MGMSSSSPICSKVSRSNRPPDPAPPVPILDAVEEKALQQVPGHAARRLDPEILPADGRDDAVVPLAGGGLERVRRHPAVDVDGRPRPFGPRDDNQSAKCEVGEPPAVGGLPKDLAVNGDLAELSRSGRRPADKEKSEREEASLCGPHAPRRFSGKDPVRHLHSPRRDPRVR